jgi:YidC/Oxa1 family membrane protein insertase
MFKAIADVLQIIVQPCYALTGNWWIAILLFTIIIKIILMPLALWVQKNAIKMVQIMPAINRLKVKYYGDSETIGEKQNDPYQALEDRCGQLYGLLSSKTEEPDIESKYRIYYHRS